MIGKINIVGLIGTIGNEKGVELIDVISQVRKQPDATEFEVYIKSEGGVVETGFQIYNFIKSLGLPITTIGDEIVASIATIPFMAGDKRIRRPGTQFMIHLPMGGIEFATAEEMEIHSKHVKEVENQIVNFYTKELNLNKEAIFPLLKNETWLNETQLMDLGFTTEIVKVQIAARFKNFKPKSNKNMSNKKSKLRAILNAILGDTVNKIIYSADNKELVFPELAEDDEIEVGAKATFDGAPANGEIVGADGKTYVFADGILTEIKEVVEEIIDQDITDTEDIADALITILEVVEEMSGEVAEIREEVVAVKKENTAMVAKLKAAEAIIAKLKGSSASPSDDGKKEKGQKAQAVDVVANWRKNKRTKK